MAHDDASGLPGRAGDGAADALEARVSRLEAELEALRRQIAAGGPPPAIAQPSPAAPPPPPAAVSAPSPAPPEPEPLVEKWVFTAKHETAASVPAASYESLESRLGSQIFNRIAIVLLLIGTAYGMKLAADRGLLGPGPRVILGLISGAALVIWSERFRRRGFALFSYSLKAVGSGVLYLALWAAFQRFHLLPAPAAMAMMILVTAWNAYMAWVQDSELLAAYALAGGLASPLLVSTGGNHEIFLFSYLLAIDLATVALVRVKAWPRLLLGAFPATVLFFIAWYWEYFHPNALGITSVFIALFAAVFGTVPIARSEPGDAPKRKISTSFATLVGDVLLPLADAAFAALAFYSVLQDAGHHDWLPWLMLVLAAVYLGLMRLPQTRTASAIHLSLAVVLLTIAIPLKASGAWITASWLVEGLALLWVAARLAQPAEDDAAMQVSWVLRPLALGSLLLGFGGVCLHIVGWADVAALPLLNKGTGTALTAIAVFALGAWLALHADARSAEPQKLGSAWAWPWLALLMVLLIDVTAGLLTLREVAFSWGWPDLHAPFRSADFVVALFGLAVFAGVIGASLRISAEQHDDGQWKAYAAGSTVAFNLIGVLTGVREISSIWGATSITVEQGFQQALAISAFLMAYGAALLAVGFWKRSSFLRWQALGLLILTIVKAFLYDMRNLSQGYRVVSFLALGSLLMAISFAYQKDWLHLRGSESKQESGAAR